ncbi:MAG: Ig-like domain repeat protein, partial [Acidimicrobiales bacterium]
NYTIGYVAGEATVGPAFLTITASSGPMTYGGAVPSVTAGYSGFQNGDGPASLNTGPTCSTKATSSSPVGSYVSSCSGAADPNYTINYVVGVLTVGEATPTVSVSGQSGQTTGPVTISVTVRGPKGVDVPTGSITVSDPTNSCSVTAVDSTGNGSCSLMENASQDGKSVTAKYSGDPSYTPATGKTTEAVAKATPTVSLSGPSSAVTGLISYEVTVSGRGATPSGKVTVSDGTSTCTSALNAEGIGGCALQEDTGSYPVKAGYTGDDNYRAASATTTEVVNETTTSLDVSTSTLVYGLEQSANFSVTVYPPVGDDTAPSGTTVQLIAGKQTLCVTSPLVVTTVTVTNPVSGQPVQITEATAACHLAPAAVAAGKYSVTADFPGESGSFVGSTSTSVPLTVVSAPTSTTLSVSNSTTSYGSESSETLTTRVSGPAGPSYVTGSVTFKTGSRTLCVTTLANGTGKCTLTRFQLSVGRYSLVADYQGTKSLVSSSSKPLTLSVVAASTSTALSLSRTTVAFRTEQSERFTAQVAVPAGMAYASGTVVVTSGSRSLCTITLIRGKGTCSLTATELPVGSYQISARYEGSNELKASTSPGKKLVVTKAS